MSQVSLALTVPSVVVPRERNYLLNPAHSAFARTVASAKEAGFARTADYDLKAHTEAVAAQARKCREAAEAFNAHHEGKD